MVPRPAQDLDVASRECHCHPLRLKVRGEDRDFVGVRAEQGDGLSVPLEYYFKIMYTLIGTIRTRLTCPRSEKQSMVSLRGHFANVRGAKPVPFAHTRFSPRTFRFFKNTKEVQHRSDMYLSADIW